MKINRVFFRYLAFALEIILLWALQSTPRLFPEWFGEKPFLLLAAALSFAACENVVPSLIFGAVCGAFADLSATGNIGFFAAAFTLVCYCEANLLETYLTRNIFTFFIIAAAASFSVLGLYFALFRLTSGIPDSGVLFVGHYLIRMGLTVLAALPLYFFNRFLRKSLCSPGEGRIGIY